MFEKINLKDLIFNIKENNNLKITLYINYSIFKIFGDCHNNCDLEIQSEASLHENNNFSSEQLVEINKLRSKGEELKTSRLIEMKNNNSVIVSEPFYEIDKINKKFDLIIGDLPLGLMKEEYVNIKNDINIKEQRNWLVLLKSLFLLSEKGIGVYLVEPAFINSPSGINFIKLLNNKGFFIKAIFNTPEKSLKPMTSLRPIVIVISKEKKDKIFVAELDNNINHILENWKNNKSKNLSEGIFLELNKFDSFDKYKISKQLNDLSLKYNDFKKYSIKELSNEINIGKELKEKENSIYIPKIGNSKTFSALKDTSIKHQNLIQVVLDKKILDNSYLSLFFNSKIGKLTLRTLFSGNIIQHINKKDIENLLVSIPSKNLQKKIIKSNEKLEQLKIKITYFEQEIALNPKSVDLIQDDLNNMLNSLNMLNEADKILSLIREGEHKNLEFKSTLRKSIEKEGIPDSVIEKATLKNIAGFMNSEGGILLVGVNDEGNILGLDNDGFKSKDDILKHVKNLIKRDFGPEFYDLIDYKIINVDDKQVLQFECKPSKKAVFLGKKEFYVRTNPATDKLEGEELINYIQNHFGGNLK